MLRDTFFLEMQPTILKEAHDANMRNSLNNVDMVIGSLEEAEDNVNNRNNRIVEMFYSIKSLG